MHLLNQLSGLIINIITQQRYHCSVQCFQMVHINLFSKAWDGQQKGLVFTKYWNLIVRLRLIEIRHHGGFAIEKYPASYTRKM